MVPNFKDFGNLVGKIMFLFKYPLSELLVKLTAISSSITFA